MPRNFRRRVEVMFPILDDSLRRRVIEEILGTMRADTAKGWCLRSDGTYERVTAEGGKTVRSQQRFVELARERAREPETLLTLNAKPFAAASAPTLEKLRRKSKKKKRRKKERFE
jgi:polyphosphate kinase